MGQRKKLKLRELRKILARYGVTEDPSRGKGGHTMFFKHMGGIEFSYPIPSKKEVKDCYVRGARRKFQLTAEDGVSDDEFYG